MTPLMNTPISITLAACCAVIGLLPLTLQAQTYTYDGVGRLVGVQYTDTTEVRYSYDKNGNMLSMNSGTTAVEAPATSPAGFALPQNYPNPFNPSTVVTFSLPRREHVTIDVCDMLGRTLVTMCHAPYPPGTHAITLDAASLPAGVYTLRMRAGPFTASRAMTLLK